MKLPYLLLDVFTERPLSGNPLAVVPEADDLLDDEMQAIAREFNLSETIFFTRAKSERNATGVRIFTPAVELPFAGHPTVGAAVVLGLRDKQQVVRLEGQIGLITSVVEAVSKTMAKAVFGLPRLPERTGDAPADKAIARALGLEEVDIGCGLLRPAMYSAGNPFYLIPVRDAAALTRIKPFGGVWALTFLLAILIASGSAAVNTAEIAGGEATKTNAGETMIGDALAPDSRVVEGTLIVPPTQRVEAENAADNTATLALWGFLTMLLSGIAAVFGGLYGTRTHRWMAKAGLEGRTAPELSRADATERSEPHKVYPTPRS